MVGFRKEFDVVRHWRTVEDWSLGGAALLMITEFSLTRAANLPQAITIIQIITCLLVVCSVMSNVVADYLLYQAEEDKRLDLLDNAFGRHRAEWHSKGYYNNDTLPNGFNKLAMNNFESSFFTYKILKSGLLTQWAILAVVWFAFLLVSLSGVRDVVVLLIQVALPMQVCLNAIRYFVTFFRVKAIYKSYRLLYNNGQHPRASDLMFNVLNYTAALAYGRLLLSNTRYSRMNESLSAEWESIRNTFLSKE